MTERKSENFLFNSDWRSISGLQRFCHQAMAATFEVYIIHEDARYAQQAARGAFDEVDRLEADLSLFIENSDISRINNLPAGRSLQLGLSTFECLQISAKMNAETKGAFDVTIGSLLACWRDKDESSRTPSQEQLNFARKHTGMHLLKLNEADYTVELLASPVQVDLGGIGKGYAVDRMAQVLREWGINTTLISGGYSSILAMWLGHPGRGFTGWKPVPRGTKGWPVTLSNPGNRNQVLARLCFRNRSLSASGVKKGRHIIDPRTAQPITGKLAAWACAPDAANSDALSTAFMVMSTDEIKKYCSRHPDVMAMVILEDGGNEIKKDRVLLFGPWKKNELLI